MEKQNQPRSEEPKGTGRVSNIDGSGQTDQSRDISSIDRQEGEMDHGETGGNFKPAQDPPPTSEQRY